MSPAGCCTRKDGRVNWRKTCIERKLAVTLFNQEIEEKFGLKVIHSARPMRQRYDHATAEVQVTSVLFLTFFVFIVMKLLKC